MEGLGHERMLKPKPCCQEQEARANASLQIEDFAVTSDLTMKKVAPCTRCWSSLGLPAPRFIASPRSPPPDHQAIITDHATLFGAKFVSSDLVAGEYEGGLKLWECAVDLVAHLHQRCTQDPLFVRGRRVLELGCGHGLPGIFALQRGAEAVVLQDYNAEVLTGLTAANVRANVNPAPVPPEVRYVAGDWGEGMAALLQDPGYDIILTAETIYTARGQERLLALMTQCLRPGGEALVAAKTYYFGVGGGTREFETRVARGRVLRVERVAEFKDGASNVREILRLTHREES